MIWYSPLVPLLFGVLLLTVSAFMSRSGGSLDTSAQARCGLAIVGLLLVLPGYALMTPLGANLLVLIIEHRTKAAETAPICDDVQAMVLLSGGLKRPARASSDFGALTAETLDRVFAWQHGDSMESSSGLPLIIAGGGPFRIPEAEVIFQFLTLFNPDHRSVQLEIISTNTRESALAVRDLLPNATNRIMLASSALHLPRAMLAFEQAGFEVCPLALNRHYLAVTGWTTLLPQSSSLAKSESALHEIMGEVYYRINPSDPTFPAQEISYSTDP